MQDINKIQKDNLIRWRACGANDFSWVTIKVVWHISHLVVTTDIYNFPKHVDLCHGTGTSTYQLISPSRVFCFLGHSEEFESWSTIIVDLHITYYSDSRNENHYATTLSCPLVSSLRRHMVRFPAHFEKNSSWYREIDRGSGSAVVWLTQKWNPAVLYLHRSEWRAILSIFYFSFIGRGIEADH